ncbi:hypothetical protein AAMO2058_001133300 [Amorphochlora amoebiformis]
MGVHRWQHRWFALYDDRLEYYKAKEDSKPTGSIPTNFILQIECLQEKKLRFNITLDGETKRIFSLKAETPEMQYGVPLLYRLPVGESMITYQDIQISDIQISNILILRYLISGLVRGLLFRSVFSSIPLPDV